jgi:SAM-dependent methyltransferase
LPILSDAEDAEYVQMMDFICRVEAVQAVCLGSWLYERLMPESVIDLGCGPGLYLLPYAAKGCYVCGVDACSEAGRLLAPYDFVTADLRSPYWPDATRLSAYAARYDLALCLETCEHLPPECTDTLLDSVCRCSDTVLFSCAVPGQGGSFHVAERTHEDILGRFAARGYGLHPLHADMRAYLETFRDLEATGAVSGWIINNSFLLQKDA